MPFERKEDSDILTKDAVAAAGSCAALARILGLTRGAVNRWYRYRWRDGQRNQAYKRYVPLEHEATLLKALPELRP